MSKMNYCLQYYLLGVVNQRWNRVGMLSFLSLTLSLTCCTNQGVPGHSNKASGGYERSYADEVAANRRRAAYWRDRGYDFNYRDTTASQMDRFASVWTPSGWSEFKAMAEQTLSDEAKRKAAYRHSNPEGAALSAHVAPENSGSHSTPTLIVPRPKPLPAIGP